MKGDDCVDEPIVGDRYMLVFGDEGTRIVDTFVDVELYAIEVVDLLNRLDISIRKLENNWGKCKIANERLRVKVNELKSLAMGEYDECKLYGCHSCEHYTYKDYGDDGDSWCMMKNRKLYFLERNWFGGYEDYEYDCFKPKKLR